MVEDPNKGQEADQSEEEETDEEMLEYLNLSDTYPD